MEPNVNCTRIISESEDLIQWLDSQIDGLVIKSDLRSRIAAGCLYMAMDFHKALVLLSAHELYGAAFANVRLLFEAYVRGVWADRCAADEDLGRFKDGKVPKLHLMIEAIERTEGHEAKVLSQIKKSSYRAMNTFTHTGFQQIVRYQTESAIEPNHEPEEIAEVIEWANCMGFIAAAAALQLSKDSIVANAKANAILTQMKRRWPLAADA